MDIFVLSKYSSIAKENETFCIKNKDTKQIVSPLKVDSILISQKCSISTDAILLASDYDIDIIVLNDYGDPGRKIMYNSRTRSIYRNTSYG